ncbi:hypothetical protein [Medusavirus stheno T3]|uniref:Uncharacterized protein n=1 Tax=Medusavirus stheno T3 TaxID=3069717 RepID=A0A7S7YFR7_9VIRU|nr:hypothetical protein QKU73_gp154 [Acanthamoeba castellanii medusavirus]QPB44335.1 hypothetical protein [Medusavirus stheno T3]
MEHDCTTPTQATSATAGDKGILFMIRQRTEAYCERVRALTQLIIDDHNMDSAVEWYDTLEGMGDELVAYEEVYE